MPLPPKDPDYFDKINWVIDSWVIGCDAPWYIYIETMGPAALKAFITLLTFGWDDVARGYFRPRGLYRRRTGKNKGKWGKYKPKFPELGEEIGKKLPGATEVKGLKWSTLGKTLWRIDGAVQQVFFWWLVADVTVEFAYEWTSLLYKSRWCEPDQPGKFSHSRTGHQSQPGGTWRKINYPDLDYQYPPPSWNFAKGWSGPSGCSVFATATFARFGVWPPPDNAAVRVKSDVNPTVYGDTGSIGTQPSDITPLLLKCQVPPNVLFRVETWHDSAQANVGNGVVVGVQTVAP